MTAKTGIKFRKIPALFAPTLTTAVFQEMKATIDAKTPVYKMVKTEELDQRIGIFKMKVS
jgi:hypothetical protein